MSEIELQFLDESTFVNEEFHASNVSPRQFDEFLANGWRHFGTHFFRYSFGFYQNSIRTVIPLRVCLRNYAHSKSHRRIIRKNEDLRTIIRPTEITNEKVELFERHKLRFDHGIPDSLHDFLALAPAAVPVEGMEICVYDKQRLIAASFFDVGETSISGIYGMFAPRRKPPKFGNIHNAERN